MGSIGRHRYHHVQLFTFIVTHADEIGIYYREILSSWASTCGNEPRVCKDLVQAIPNSKRSPQLLYSLFKEFVETRFNERESDMNVQSDEPERTLNTIETLPPSEVIELDRSPECPETLLEVVFNQFITMAREEYKSTYKSQECLFQMTQYLLNHGAISDPFVRARSRYNPMLWDLIKDLPWTPLSVCKAGQITIADAT